MTSTTTQKENLEPESEEEWVQLKFPANELKRIKINFQGRVTSLEELNPQEQHSQVVNLPVIHRLLCQDEIPTITIPPMQPSDQTEQQSVYIPQCLAEPFGDLTLLYVNLHDKVELPLEAFRSECKIGSGGQVQCRNGISDDGKQNIWKQLMMTTIQLTKKTISEDDLINADQKRVIKIISVIAGVGKSPLLSSLIKKLEGKHPSSLILKIDLKTISTDIEEISNHVDWLLQLFSAFTGADGEITRWLLTDRLKTGKGIALMLENFNNINPIHQDRVIQHVNNIAPSVPVYVTTLPETADKLQLRLGQLAYHLLTGDCEQTRSRLINYLEQTDPDRCNLGNMNVSVVNVVDRLVQELSEEERNKIGVASQWSYIAEAFGKIYQNGTYDAEQLAENIYKELFGSRPADSRESRRGSLASISSQHATVPIKDSERQLALKWSEAIYEKLAKELGDPVDKIRGEMGIDSITGSIKWSAEDKRKSNIWDKLQPLLDNETITSPINCLSEKDVVESYQKRFIIIGAAGTGKSTYLRNLYQKFQHKIGDILVVHIDLPDQSQSLLKFSSISPDEKSRDIPVAEKATNFFFDIIDQHAQFERTKFSQSLLRERLVKGDRVVFLMDDLDELDDNCQGILLRLMDHLNPGVKLIITVRFPVVAKRLQSRWNQVAHYLVEMQQEQMINYMTDYWKIAENSSLQSDNNRQREMKKFAKALLDKVSRVWSDQEKYFIDIPLRCRLLAESFRYDQTLEKEIKHDGCKNDISPEDSNTFELVNLYRLFIEMKSPAMSGRKKSRLILLALKNIVPKQDHSNVFSQLDNASQGEPTLDVDSYHGLLAISSPKQDNDNSEKWIRFIHQTLPEYLVAELIYNALTNYDDETNDFHNLLDNPKIVKFVTKKLLVETEYDGVRVFLNSMLKETADATINQRIANEESDRYSVAYPFRLMGRSFLKYSGQSEDSVLETVLNSKLNNILTLYFYCIGATPIPASRKIMSDNSFIRWRVIFQLDNGNFYQFLRHYKREENKVLVQIFHHFGRYLCDLQKQNMSEDQIEDFVPKARSFIDFFKKQQTERGTDDSFSVQLFSSNWNANIIMTQLIFYEANYVHDPSSSLIKLYLKLLLFLPRPQLVAKLQMAIHDFYSTTDYWKRASIEKTLHILIELELIDVTTKVMRMVLLKEPKIFEKFYIDRSTRYNIVKQEINVTSELHVAAYYNDCDSVQLWLDDERKKLNKNSKKKAAKSVIDILTNNSKEDITPFYIAAAVGHEMIAFNFMEFLKTTLKSSELIDCYTKDNGFLRQAYWDAVEFKHVEMLEVIENVTKAALGSEALEVLSKGKFLSFPDRDAINTSQKINFDEWTTKLLNDDLDKAVEKLFLDISVDKLGLEFSSQLIKKMASSQRENGRSFWTSYVLASNNNPSNTTKNRVLINATRSVEIIKKISKSKLPLEDIKLLLWHRNGEEFVMIQPALIIEKNGVDQTLAALPDQVRQEFRNLLKSEAPKKIQDLFFAPKFDYFKMPEEIHKYKALLFYLDYGTKEQLDKFGQVITERREIDKKSTTICKEAINGLKPEKFEAFLQYRSNKVVLDKDTIIEMVFCTEDKALLPEWHTKRNFELIEQLYRHLPEKERMEITQKIYKSKGFVDGIWKDQDLKYWIKKCVAPPSDLLTSFPMFVNSFLDKLDTQNVPIFIDYILKERMMGTEERASLWGSYVKKACHLEDEEELKAIRSVIGKLFKKIKKQLGTYYIKKLFKEGFGETDLYTTAEKSGNRTLIEFFLREMSNSATP